MQAVSTLLYCGSELVDFIHVLQGYFMGQCQWRYSHDSSVTKSKPDKTRCIYIKYKNILLLRIYKCWSYILFPESWLVVGQGTSGNASREKQVFRVWGCMDVQLYLIPEKGVSRKISYIYFNASSSSSSSSSSAAAAASSSSSSSSSSLS